MSELLSGVDTQFVVSTWRGQIMQKAAEGLPISVNIIPGEPGRTYMLGQISGVYGENQVLAQIVVSDAKEMDRFWNLVDKLEAETSEK